MAGWTILGNRDPAYLVGYTFLAGRLELFDAKGRVMFARESEGTGNLRDFDFALPERAVGVKVVRFCAHPRRSQVASTAPRYRPTPRAGSTSPCSTGACGNLVALLALTAAR